MMKRILLCLMAAGCFSCKNEAPVFPDYTHTSVYFPFQYPVRTLVLGDYELDNANDRKLQFLISARVGGMYENHSDWKVDFTIDPSLAENLKTGNGETLAILPAKYYTLNPVASLTIPKGSFNGDTRVQLTEEFLDDPMAFKRHYVIPLRITASSADSVLTGASFLPKPDRRIAGEWSVPPKDFTVFGIKFINAYHGKYLHRGKSVVRNGSGAVVETVEYRQKYVEQDEVWGLQTSGRNKVTVTGALRSAAGSPGNFTMDLDFSDNGNCAVSTGAGSAFAVTGNGKFLKGGGEWGNKKRDMITLAYTVTQAGNTHNMSDTLVFRDKDVRFEEFVPVVTK